MRLHEAVNAALDLFDDVWQHDVRAQEAQVLESFPGVGLTGLAEDGRERSVLQGLDELPDLFVPNHPVLLDRLVEPLRLVLSLP